MAKTKERKAATPVAKDSANESIVIKKALSGSTKGKKNPASTVTVGKKALSDKPNGKATSKSKKSHTKATVIEPELEEADDDDDEVQDVNIPDDEFEQVISADLYADDDDDEAEDQKDDDDDQIDDEDIIKGVLDSDDDNDTEADQEENEDEDNEVFDSIALQSEIVKLQAELKDGSTTKKTLKEKRKEKKELGIVSTKSKDGSILKKANGKHPKTGVVYLGRIPHGFYEKEMKSYFSQFGEVLRLRLSRNKKTGASKHFAFIEFPTQQIAEIVADTMHGYLLFNHILQCKVVGWDKLHPETFKGANRKFKALPWNKIERQRVNRPLTAEERDKRVGKLITQELKKRSRLSEMGIEYEFGGYAGAAKRTKGEEP